MTTDRGQARRDALFDAAKRLFEEVGYARITHADIAHEAGIGRTTFYEHFASKEDLLIQLVERDLPELIEEVLAAVDSSLAPPEQLRELTIGMVEFLGTDNIGLILHTEVPKLSLEAQAAIARVHGGMSGTFTSIYRAGVEAGDFRMLPPVLAGRLIEQTVMTGARVVMASDDPKQDVHEVAEETARFLVNALAVS